MKLSISRRGFLQCCFAGATGVTVSSPFDPLLFGDEARGGEERSLILLWMNGGPSQVDTFDPKSSHQNGGGVKAIATKQAGVQISENMPMLAQRFDDVALIRSMVTKEGSHERGRYLLHTGYLPVGATAHPGLGSIVSSELGADDTSLPNFVSVTLPSHGPGLLGMPHAAFHVPDPQEKVPNASTAEDVDALRFRRRLDMLSLLQNSFIATKRGQEAKDHNEVYQKSVRLMKSRELKAFDLSQEKEAVRDAYGLNEFGQGCLLARRLVEVGVRCVEVTLDGWDTHLNNNAKSKELAGMVDSGFSRLLDDLKERRLLNKTLVVWMGEFGRTPKMNVLGGRDHWPNGWSVAMAGSNIQGGTVVGKTSTDGTKVTDRPVTVPDLFATVCEALAIDAEKENYTSTGRPIPLVNHGTAVRELFG
ncbi:MAG: hypothetical protein CMJ78_10680 [Planctomycetaceae bacterium]|nr:hypothetical protein [Planctomycetaceae bacterium]